MFTKQIMEFELRGLGSSGRICKFKTGYLYDKTKVSNENLQVKYYLLLKILLKAMYLASPYLNQFNSKIIQKILDFQREYCKQ